MVVISDKNRRAPGRIGVVHALGLSVLFVLSVVAASIEPHEDRFLWRWTAVVLAGVGCSALVWRRRHPVGALAVALGCGVGFLALGFRESPLVISPVLVSVYTVGLLTDRRTTWTSATASAAVLVGTAILCAPQDWLNPDNAALVAWTALPAAVGDGLRSRRAYVAAVEERAVHAERTREQEAQQRVAAERVRIARELHDIVAHHIALINAQAGVAAHLAKRQPEQVLTALEDIRDTSRSALDELRVTVGLLRQSGDPVAPRSPAPGLADIPVLLASFARAGLAVDHTRHGAAAAPLTPAVDLTAYRIVQEALTNVRKHAGADRARLTLHHHPERLTITVEDDGGTARHHPAPAGTGHGLVGMRERVAMVGGRLHAGPRPEGGFRVTADLPLRPGRLISETARRDGHDDSRTACR
ncbi:sensor histidine kinase [Streptomyces sp. NPDC003674]